MKHVGPMEISSTVFNGYNQPEWDAAKNHGIKLLLY